MRIFIVDDNPDMLELQAALFKYAGWDVETAGRGTEAIEVLSRPDASRFDIVMLDIAMPVIDGLTVADQVRKNERLGGIKPSRIVFFTGSEETDAVKRIADRAGVAAIFQKGRDTMRIVEKVEACLV